MIDPWPPLTVVVGSGGVGKTTLAAALGIDSAQRGLDTLVMTFDPSLRLKDSLGVDDEAKEVEMEVGRFGPGHLWASLLDARRTFDRLIAEYAPTDAARERILSNRYYRQLAGSLAGILEYMAVERLFEVAESGRFDRVILDTPPTRQALDFLEAPERIVGFLDSGALKLALRPWFDQEGHLRGTTKLGRLGRTLEGYLDEVVGLDLLRDMVEFFQAFGPLYSGFRQRAIDVQRLLRSETTEFCLVSGPGDEKIPDTLFFARRLEQAGHRLGSVIVNRMHPRVTEGASGSKRAHDVSDGRVLLEWLGERDHRGFRSLRELISPAHRVVGIPLLREEPSNLQALSRLADSVSQKLRVTESAGDGS